MEESIHRSVIFSRAGLPGSKRLFTCFVGMSILKSSGTVRGGHVGNRQRIKIRKPQPHKPAEEKSAEEIVRELKGLAAAAPNADYREQSLRIHGLICAKCGREFDSANRNLLTVHHKDGNHNNNPPDGSNWENLCIYCHEDEHSRGLLGEYLKGNE
jgi:hypothetical protein